MMSPLRNAILGGAAVLALAAASVAVAGTSTTSTTTTSPDGKIQRVMVVRDSDDADFDGAPGGDDHGFAMHRRGGDPERMAKHLREILQLTPAQEPALQAFLAAMHPAHAGPAGDHIGERMQHGPMPTDPAARKAEMDKRMAEMKTRMAEMEKKHAEEAALTTPQRLDMMVKKMAERTARRQADLQAHVAAIKSFYGALTPSQQKAFDALHGGGMERGRGMRMHMGMEMAPPMPPAPPLPPLPPLAMRAPLPPAPPLPPEPPAAPRY